MAVCEASSALPQAQILARQGLEIGRETLASWVGTAAARLFADETTILLAKSGRH